MKKHLQLTAILLVVTITVMACNLSQGSTPTQDVSLLKTETALAKTVAAVNKGQPTTKSLPTKTPKAQVQPAATDTLQPAAATNTLQAAAATDTLQAAATNTPQGAATDTLQPAATNTTQASQGLTADQIKAKIDSSNILAYEDMVGDPSFVPVVTRALKGIGGNHVNVADAMGTFMDKLNSSTKWDLIIMAAEARNNISGDYWTAIQDQVDNHHAALVVEIWYLDQINGGKIAPLLYECGIDVQQSWTRKNIFNPVDFDMYWNVPDSPVFNTPNTVERFRSSNSTDVWYGDVGDFMQLNDGSHATILASHVSGDTTGHGLISSCMNGTVLFQTFSTHDYPTNNMVMLWQNYITYTLTNHFKAGQ